jgi:glycosyltransferase involved in cell wall biosynthesis
MVKILIINASFNRGGAAYIAKTIGLNLPVEEYSVFFAGGRGEKPINKNHFVFSNSIDFFFHAIFSRLFDSEGLHSYFSTKRLISFIKKLKPQIIHIHNLHGHYLNYPLLLKFLNSYNKSNSIKIFITLHDTWLYTGHCASYQMVDCEKFVLGCNHCPEVNFYPKSFVDLSRRNYNIKKKLFLELTNLVLIAPSFWIKFELAKSFLRNLPVRLIHNGVKENFFNGPINQKIEHKFDKFKSKKVLLFVASIWSVSKGFDVLLELTYLIDPLYHILIVGELNNKQISSLNKNKKSSFTILNRLDKEILNYLFSISIFFINPTFKDNFPTVNIEALMQGCPIITFNTGGCGEVINTSNGVLLNDKSANGIQKVLMKLENKIFDRKMIKENAIQDFNIDNMVESHIKLFKS